MSTATLSLNEMSRRRREFWTYWVDGWDFGTDEVIGKAAKLHSYPFATIDDAVEFGQDRTIRVMAVANFGPGTAVVLDGNGARRDIDDDSDPGGGEPAYVTLDAMSEAA